jgi:hypothetical protein
MAQWKGQYTGLTHESKVQDLEALLRLTVAAFDAALESERESKARAVHQLSHRLLSARLKALRARISKLLEPGVKRNSGDQVSQLQAQKQNLRAQGMASILKEFDFHE